MPFKPGDKVIDLYRSPYNKGNEGVVVCIERVYKKKMSVNGIEFRTKDRVRTGYPIVVRFRDGGREIYMPNGQSYITMVGCYVPRIALYLESDPILKRLGLKY